MTKHKSFTRVGTKVYIKPPDISIYCFYDGSWFNPTNKFWHDKNGNWIGKGKRISVYGVDCGRSKFKLTLIEKLIEDKNKNLNKYVKGNEQFIRLR